MSESTVAKYIETHNTKSPFIPRLKPGEFPGATLNVKAVYKGRIVGYIIVQDRNINLPMKRRYTENEKQDVRLLKSKNGSSLEEYPLRKSIR